MTVLNGKVESVDRFFLCYITKILSVIHQSQFNINVIHCNDRIQFWLACIIQCFTSQMINLFRRPSFWRINNNHVSDRLTELLGVSRRNWFIVAFCNVIKQVHQRHLFLLVSERRVQLAKLINDTPQWPHISIFVVTGVLNKLGRHVQWCAYFRIGFESLTTKASSQAQISNF